MKPFPLLLHANYFEQGQTLDRACRLARELAVDGIEFRRHPAGFPGRDLEYLDEVCRALDRSPQEWVSFGAPGVNLMSPDADLRARELEKASTFYRRAAERLPIKVINAFAGNLANPDKTVPYLEYHRHGSAIATDAQWRQAIDGYRQLGSLAAELGFRFAFETHGVYLHDTITASMKLVEEINSPQVGVLWDHANLMLFPEVPTLAEAITALGSRIYAVHLKNLLINPSQLLCMSSLGDGIINVREQLRLLVDAGYEGPICIESPRAGDREHFLRQDVEYYRAVIQDLAMN